MNHFIESRNDNKKIDFNFSLVATMTLNDKFQIDFKSCVNHTLFPATAISLAVDCGDSAMRRVRHLAGTARPIGESTTSAVLNAVRNDKLSFLIRDLHGSIAFRLGSTLVLRDAIAQRLPHYNARNDFLQCLGTNLISAGAAGAASTVAWSAVVGRASFVGLREAITRDCVPLGVQVALFNTLQEMNPHRHDDGLALQLGGAVGASSIAFLAVRPLNRFIGSPTFMKYRAMLRWDVSTFPASSVAVGVALVLWDTWKARTNKNKE